MSANTNTKKADRTLMIDICQRFYLEEQSKTEIADALGLSRFKVARLIASARSQGLVQIRIGDDSPATPLGRELKQAYGLEFAEVADGPFPMERGLWDGLGRTAAFLLERVLTDRDILGISWGRSIQAILPHLTRLPQCPVVQLSAMTGGPENNSTEVVRRFAKISNGMAYPLYAPLVLPNTVTTQGLLQEAGIAETFARHSQVTVAVMSIGSWVPPNSQLRLQFQMSEVERLTKRGVVAEIGRGMLNEAGELIDDPATDRILAISPDRLRRIPTVIAVAGGAAKALAIDSVLTSRLINSLVTDEGTARALIRKAESR